MRNEGSVFGAAMEMNSKMELVGIEFMDATMELAVEITRKPKDTLTENELKFIKAAAHFSIMGLISSKVGID